MFTKKLANRILIVNDVSTNVKLHKILKHGYYELYCIRTIPKKIDHFFKYVFVMIKQLGPSTFFVTFTKGVNNWLIL